MLRRACLALAVMVCLVAPLLVQAQGDYLDIYTVKVKPEKVADFEAIARKMVEANRKNGDHWLATEVVYGDGDTYTFISTRQDYADIDKGSNAFYGALAKAYGKEGTQKLLGEWEACLTGSHSEFRKRRWDLSRKAPDAASYAKFIADSRLLRTTAVHIRPGHITEFEDVMKEVKAAGEKNPNTQPLLVSQVMEGSKGATFYVSALRPSMGGFDNNPTTREILGEDGFKKFQQMNADAVESSESVLLRFSPELSNPPEEVIAAAPGFWQPKAMAATHMAKPKSPAEPAAKKTKEQ
jgi:hypothetical protein